MKNIIPKLYLNEWMQLGQAEMGEKYSSGFLTLFTTGSVHHKEWKIASIEILISFFLTTKNQLFPHQPHTNIQLMNDPKSRTQNIE